MGTGSPPCSLPLHAVYRARTRRYYPQGSATCSPTQSTVIILVLNSHHKKLDVDGWVKGPFGFLFEVQVYIFKKYFSWLKFYNKHLQVRRHCMYMVSKLPNLFLDGGVGSGINLPTFYAWISFMFTKPLRPVLSIF